MIKELENDQKKILDKIKKKIILDKYNSGLNIFRYLSNSNKLSYVQMQFTIHKRYLIKYIYLCLKNFFSFFFYYDFEIYQSSSDEKYDKIIISWGTKRDFDKKGNFIDKYCGIKSYKEKKTLWIVQYDEQFLPKKISKNVIIFKRSNKKIFYFSKLFQLIKEIKLDLSFFKNFSSSSLYALIFYHHLFKNLKKSKIKNVFIPYEGQLFQKYLIKKFHKNGLKVTGIIHTFLQPIPFNIFFDSHSSPSKIYVPSKSLKNCLIKHMNWKKEKIFVKKSSRFSRNKIFDMNKKLFFPYELPDTKKLEKIFFDFFNLYKNKINFNLDIKIHPAKLKNNIHLDFKKKISNLIRNNKKQNLKINNNVSIFFEYTSSIIEALERGITVIQICTEPILQVYTPYIYKGVRVKKISENIFEYKKIKKNSLIRM